MASDELLRAAVRLHQLGRVEEAARLYNDLLKRHPHHADALHLLGVAAAQSGNHHEATRLIGRAVELQPTRAAFHLNLGNAQLQSGRIEAALGSYRTVSRLEPQYTEAHVLAGNVCRQLRQPDSAVDSYDRAIALEPGNVAARVGKAQALIDLADWQQAETSIDAAIALNGDLAEAHLYRGLVQEKLGHLGQALASFERAISLAPERAAAHLLKGNALQAVNRPAESVACYDNAIRIQPDFALAYYNRGVAFDELRQYDAAVASYERALAISPQHALAHLNLGLALQNLGQTERALLSYDRAIEIDPSLAKAQWNKSMALLSLGRFEEGWPLYEWRWEVDGFVSPRRNFPQPLWLGQDSVKGKTVLLHAEQGFGDTLQFCRYVPLVAGQGARVVLSVPSRLRELLSALPGVESVVVDAGIMPEFDLHCPLLSLPLAFSTRATSVPHSMRYIEPSGEKVDLWLRRLGKRNRLRVGLVWSGNPAHSRNRERSLRFSQLVEYLPPGCEYVSLQKDIDSEDLNGLVARPDIMNTSADQHDFTDAAALCELMDVVVTVDTSIAHLSAALGKPTWILLSFVPDWRWMFERADSPWYPTAKLFRQPAAGDWDGALSVLRTALLARIAAVVA